MFDWLLQKIHKGLWIIQQTPQRYTQEGMFLLVYRVRASLPKAQGSHVSLPDFSKFIVETSAYSTGLGAVLMQES